MIYPDKLPQLRRKNFAATSAIFCTVFPQVSASAVAFQGWGREDAEVSGFRYFANHKQVKKKTDIFNSTGCRICYTI